MENPSVQKQLEPARSNWSGLTFESSVSRSAGYRPDVDGLRAIAVLAVLFFHTGFLNFPGGFVGVDVFYVISGYLITSLLAREMLEDKFSLVSFYERRARRIFPALFTVLFFCILAAAILFDPQEMIGFGKALVTTTLFTSNFYFWHSARPLGYFDTNIRSQALLHTWSLSVEEQFYLFFPLTLFLLFRWQRRWINPWLLLLTIVSFALSIWSIHHYPIVAFYWLIPRAWELLVGSLLAMKAIPSLPNRVARELAGWLGIAMICFALRFQIPAELFPGWFALLPCLGAGLVIYAGEAGPSSVRAILGLRPFVFIGVISYSLYLWHWPIIVFSKHLPFRFTGRTEIMVVLLSSLVMAFVSFEYIERPFRGKSSPITRRQVFGLGLAASVLTLSFGIAAYRSQGLPGRYDPQTRQVIAGNLARIDDFDGSCGNFRNEVHKLDDIKFCDLGSQSPHKILFWGDSHVEQLYPAVEQIYKEGGLGDQGAVFAIEDGCLPDAHLNNTREGYHCDSFAKFAMMRAEEKDIGTVFLGFSTWWDRRNGDFCISVDEICRNSLSSDDLRRNFLADLADEIHQLQANGKNVIVCLPFPVYDVNLPELEISNAVFGRFGLAEDPVDRTSISLGEEVRATAISNGAEILDPRETLCSGSQCRVQIGGVSIYMDSNHIARSQIAILENPLRNALLAQPPRAH
jgi:peptidoglycan/LPS O-acetylase OafA/YrhL